MNESEITLSLIQHLRQNREQVHTTDLEVHYDHYGTRGALDLIAETETDWGKTLEPYEIKSEHALKDATGPNEVIRQFTKHQDYFFDGNDDYYKRNYDKVSWRLIIHATADTIAHAEKYADLYRQVEIRNNTPTWVLLYHPDIGISYFAGEETVEDWQNAEQLMEVAG